MPQSYPSDVKKQTPVQVISAFPLMTQSIEPFIGAIAPLSAHFKDGYKRQANPIPFPLLLRMAPLGGICHYRLKCHVIPEVCKLHSTHVNNRKTILIK